MDDGALGLVSLISGIAGLFIGILLVHLGVLLGLIALVCGVLDSVKNQKHSLPGILSGIATIAFSLIYSYMSMSRFRF